MINTIKITCIIIIVLLLTGCTSQTVQRSEQLNESYKSMSSSTSTPKFQSQLEDIKYRPLNLPCFFQSHTPLSAEPYVLKSYFNKSIIDDSKHISKIVDGFRVQIYSGKDRANARFVENKLKKLFDMNVYFLYEAPFYKVRIGNFINRNIAARFGMDMRKNGFKDAWVVKSAVTIE